MKQRSVDEVIPAIQTVEGGGFVVQRPFPTRELDHFDPFLLLDHFGPVTHPPGEAKGAPDHPHRGFETVTYILQGEMEHKDSQGHRGVIRTGDVQWMTAGAGVVHSEMPSANFQRQGGTIHGFQLWVNLPRKDKMMRPRYQDVPSARIPVATSADGKTRVKVIAGEALGARAVIDTRTAISYLHFSLQPGARHTQPVPESHNAMVYLISGAASVSGQALSPTELALLAPDGDGVVLESQPGAELLLISGMPLREPVARYGPFVMNTRQEIIQAFEDFHAGQMGVIQA